MYSTEKYKKSRVRTDLQFLPHHTRLYRYPYRVVLSLLTCVLAITIPEYLLLFSSVIKNFPTVVPPMGIRYEELACLISLPPEGNNSGTCWLLMVHRRHSRGMTRLLLCKYQQYRYGYLGYDGIPGQGYSTAAGISSVHTIVRLHRVNQQSYNTA